MRDKHTVRLDLTCFDRLCHELRKPVSVVKAFGELLEDEIFGPLNEEQREQVETIVRNADRMEVFVRDLYALAEAEAGQPHLKRDSCDLELVCMEVQDELGPEFRARRVRLLLDSAGPFVGESAPEGLRSILRRLLADALQASPAGTEVRLVARQEGDRVRLEVLDEGPGLVNLDHDAVFAVPSTKRTPDLERQGLDVGLRVSRSIAEALGGTIQVRNRPTRGAHFIVELPWEVAAPVA